MMKAAIAVVAKEKITKGKKTSGYPSRDKEARKKNPEEAKDRRSKAEEMTVPSSDEEDKFQVVKGPEGSKEK